MFDKWLFVLRNLSSLFEHPRALQNRVFDCFFEVAEIAKFNPKELSECRGSLKNFCDWYSVMSTHLKKGREESREEGIEKKRKVECFKNARKMKQTRIIFDIIAQVTGLSAEEIASL